MAVLRLKARADRRLRTGHLWLYSNEIDVAHNPLKSFSPGELVVVEDARGKPLGQAYVNPNTLICGRMLSRDHREQIDGNWLLARIRAALALREALFDQPCYRLIYGEADGLPGLVVDRYGDVLVCQFNTAGIDRMADLIVAALVQLFDPQVVVVRNDTSSRTLEGLASHVETVYGTLPAEVLIEENGTHFAVPVIRGQKTGWFYDHRVNRRAVQAMAPGRSVLDVFSYIGGWGVQAAQAGASDVTMIDASEFALELALENADRNGCRSRCSTLHGKALAAIKELQSSGRLFDIIVLDPPAFIKRRKDIEQGEIGYRRVNEQALRLLRPGGFLVSASCSMQLGVDRLQAIVAGSARHWSRELKVIGQGSQGPDHPVHPAIVETAYLKALFCQVN